LPQQAADGARNEIAPALAVAGIVEARAGPPLPVGPLVERHRLGALHVGLEAAEPEQPRRAARTLTHRKAAGRGTGSHLQEFQATIAHVMTPWPHVFRRKSPSSARGLKRPKRKGQEGVAGAMGKSGAGRWP